MDKKLRTKLFPIDKKWFSFEEFNQFATLEVEIRYYSLVM